MDNPPSTPHRSTPGSQMVYEALGASPFDLYRLHADGPGPESVLAGLLHAAASHLDHLHEQFTDAARDAATTLTRVVSGTTSINSLGVLQYSGTQIDILAARRADALERLREVIGAYQQVTAPKDSGTRRAERPPAAPAPAPTPTRGARR